MPLYHKKFGFPEFEVNFHGDLIYGEHARLRCINKKIDIFDDIYFNENDIIEVEYTNKLEKLVVRVEYSSRKDIIFVLIPRNNVFFVKTVWLNNKSDNHTTLNSAIYEKGNCYV